MSSDQINNHNNAWSKPLYVGGEQGIADDNTLSKPDTQSQSSFFNRELQDSHKSISSAQKNNHNTAWSEQLYTGEGQGIADDNTLSKPDTRLQSSCLKDSIHAERFIPMHKQQQWEQTPCALVMTAEERNLTELDRWIYDPIRRRSNFDSSTFNLLHFTPQMIQYLQTCLFAKSVPVISGDALQSHNAQLHHLYKIIKANRRRVKEIEEKLTFLTDLKKSLKNISFDAIREEYLRSGSQFYFPRIIQTTPETLARICDEIQSIADGGGIGSDSKSISTLSGCLLTSCRDYLTKTSMLMDIERLQSSEDMKAYDMYACKFDYIEIPPPRKPIHGCPSCRRSRKYGLDKEYCAYHFNLSLHHTYRLESLIKMERKQGRNKPAIVSTDYQFKNLSKTLGKKISRHPQGCERVIGYFTVPGVAENRPLVAIGDLLRMRFGNEEIIGQVGDVEIKSEKVLCFLPIPEKMKNVEFTNFRRALESPKNKSKDMKYDNNGRFDVRFGLFGSRGHDIFKDIFNQLSGKSMDQVARIIAPTPFLEGIQKKTDRRAQLGISDWAYSLNQEQKHAVFDIVRSNHGSAPYCIYGPPGTGKTMTVAESIVQLLRHDTSRKILVCAPSDVACDVIAKRLLPVKTKETKVLRINWWSRNPSSLPPVLLPYSPMDDKGFFVFPSTEEIKEANVIICQCFVAGCLEPSGQTPWMDTHFSHVFIDESSQSFEFESLIPLLKVGKECKIVVAGDPKQLGPTVRSRCAGRNGLSLSLQERLMGLPLYQMESNYCVITKLLDNYRSHDALLQVPSELFYKGSLRCKASSKVTKACEMFELLPDGRNFPMMVYDVNNGKELNKIDTPSFYNVEECNAVVKIIKALLESPNVEINAGQIAVITCFRAQVLKMREILRLQGLNSINVGVVEDFQGQETSVVLISTVLTKNHERWKSGPKGGLGFMMDPKKFNVAITRASALCAIVGNADFLENSGSYWTALIEHIRRNGGISGSRNLMMKNETSSTDEDLMDYGINDFIRRVEELNLLGSGHEMDRYEFAMRGYFTDSPEWKVCL